MTPSLILVGTGAAATALAARAVAYGVTVSCVIGRDEWAAQTLSEQCGARFGGLNALPHLTGSEMVMVAVPDRVLPIVAEHLAWAWPNGREGPAAHLSGLLSADAGLGALARCGVSRLSWHPAKPLVRLFDATQLDDAFVGVESSDATARADGYALAKALHLTPFSIEAAHKPLYHAALSIGSNFTVVLASVMERLLALAGVEDERVRPLGRSLLAGTLHTLMAHSPEKALTGPIVRGDHATVAAHLNHIPPELLPVYSALAVQAVQLAQASGRIAVEDAARVLDTVANTKV